MSDEEVGLSDDSDKDPDFNFFKESKNVEADTSDSEYNDESKRKQKSRKSKPKMKKYSKFKPKQSNITKSTIVNTVSEFQHDSMNELTGREISGVVVTTGNCKIKEYSINPNISPPEKENQLSNIEIDNQANKQILNDEVEIAIPNSQHSKSVSSLAKKKYNCKVCSRVFTSLACSIKHSGVCKEEYKCIKCDFKVKSLKNLKSHVKNVHSEGKLVCTVCHEKIKSEFKLKVHMKSHNKARSKCPICKKSFKSVAVMHVHKSKVHSTRPKAQKTWSCPFCGKEYKSDRSLRYHKAVHKKAEAVQEVSAVIDDIDSETVEVQETETLQVEGNNAAEDEDILIVYVEE